MIPVICAKNTDRWVEQLNRAAGQTRYQAGLVKDARVAVFSGDCSEQLASMPNLKWAHCTYAGVEQALAQSSVPIARLIDPQLSKRMSQSALAACLDYCQHGQTYRQQQAHSQWQPHTQRLAEEVQVLILGSGELGQAAARVLIAAGFKVATHSRRAKALPWPHFSKLGVEVVGGADIVINLMPDTPQTRGFINTNFLSQMKSTAALVNFGRGSAVATADLLAALDSDTLGYALLDVFAKEPLDAHDPLWRHPKVQIWPHVSATTQIDTAARMINAHIERFLNDATWPPLVDRNRGY